jgi:sec-independent protein translocase protein TatC
MISKEAIFENFSDLRSCFVRCLLFFIISVIVNFIIAEKFLYYFTEPLLNLIKDSKAQLVYTNIVEPFAIRMNLSIIGAIFFSLPFIIWQIYSFISPGLYKREKKIVLPYLFSSPILFFVGAFFVYYFIFPNAWNFFLKFAYTENKNFEIGMMIVISDYLNLCIKMMILFGLAFQLPIMINLLLQLKVISVGSLKKARRFVIVVIFIIAAVLTPPDIFSQIALAVPLLLLYESSIWFGRFLKK